jgi:uncharacterized membrane protein
MWTAVSQGATYDLDVATDSGFTNIIYTATGLATTQHTLASPLDPLTTYYWRVRASNPCGDGAYATAFSFTTAPIPPILLVDDDDDSPNVQSYWTDALDALGVDYDIWETGPGDVEPNLSEMAAYSAILWFTGDRFGSQGNGPAAPSAATEAALANWLDNSRCFFISSQDYRWDKGLTSFMTAYLGVSNVTNDNGDYTSVTGQNVFGGLGPYILTFPYTDYTDPITPGNGGIQAMLGNNGNVAGVTKDAANYKTSYWAFGLETLPVAGREVSLFTLLDWCGVLVSYGVNLSPDSQSQAANPGEVVTYTINIQNSGLVPDTYDITISGNTWAAIPSASSIWLDAGTSSSFTVAVTVPGGAPPGDMDTAAITAVSQADPAVSDHVTLTTFVPLLGVTMGATTQAQAGDPSVTLAYSVWVTNTGNLSDTYALSLSGHSWDSTLSTSSVTLNSGQSGIVTVWVDVPFDALAGDSDMVMVTAVSQTDVAVNTSLDLTSTANAVYALLSSTPDADQSGLPGSSITYTVWVTNMGNINDDIALSVAGYSWDTLLSTSGLSLAPGQSDSLVITVTIPGDAGGGQSDTAVITATSQGDNSQNASLSLTTTALNVYKVTVSANPAALSDAPGVLVTYTLYITNSGNTTDTFTMITADNNGWMSHLSTTSLTLGAGEGDMVMVMVHVPAAAVNAEMNVTTVTAVSSNDPATMGTVELTTTAVVPGYTIYVPLIMKQ